MPSNPGLQRRKPQQPSRLLLDASQYAEQYAAEMDQLRPRVLRAALWMVQPSAEVLGRKHNAPYTHRRYLVAAALGEAGVLCSNQILIDRSKNYIRDGISLQDPSGFNPEKGKKISYPQVCRAFFGWSLISGDLAFKHLAEKVFGGEAIYRRLSKK
jgi:hypothetical protein